MVHKNPLVFVNYYAPWCYWSNKLAPDWYAPELTRARPGASVGHVQAARTRLPRAVRTRGAGQPAPPGGTHRTCCYGYAQGTCLGRAVRTAYPVRTVATQAWTRAAATVAA